MTFLEPAHGKRNTTTTGSELRRMAEREQDEERKNASLAEHAASATVYVATHPDSNEIVIHHEGGAQWVHAYSEYALLPEARFGADEVWHLHLTGAQLRRQLPAHVGIELDHGLPHARVIFPPKAVPIDEAE